MSLSPSGMQLAEYSRNVWSITVKDDIKALLKPEYWVHVAKMLKQFDRIEVLAEDGSYFADLIVTASSKKWAKVNILMHKKLAGTPKVVSAVPGFIVEWSGPHHKFRVVRDADKEIMSKEHETKELAIEWLNEHKKEIAA